MKSDTVSAFSSCSNLHLYQQCLLGTNFKMRALWFICIFQRRSHWSFQFIGTPQSNSLISINTRWGWWWCPRGAPGSVLGDCMLIFLTHNHRCEVWTVSVTQMNRLGLVSVHGHTASEEGSWHLSPWIDASKAQLWTTSCDASSSERSLNHCHLQTKPWSLLGPQVVCHANSWPCWDGFWRYIGIRRNCCFISHRLCKKGLPW